MIQYYHSTASWFAMITLWWQVFTSNFSF